MLDLITDFETEHTCHPMQQSDGIERTFKHEWDRKYVETRMRFAKKKNEIRTGLQLTDGIATSNAHGGANTVDRMAPLF